ncbi:MAG: hypothetical protein GKC03_00605 [Methanomassiliicoccales archaeon]|nr:hypothetical protein [Methanomassiliicoccales archaeon]NYT14798.1 hypothetical protein [Methanomassiliicoccales archaeon]
MGVLFRRKRQEQDEATYSLIHRGVYRVPDFYEDDEGKRFKGAKVAYSFWSAVRYTFFLSLLLWWLPIFGQMIAGYVGGRRAGTPWKGVAAALIPVTVFFVVMMAMDMGYLPTEFFGISLSPAALLGSIAAEIPLIEPFLNFSVMYLDSFLDAIQATTSLRLDSYIITIAFAYIGGILSEQTRREMDYVSKTGGPKTTVVVEGTHTSPQEVASSIPSWSAHLLQPRRRTTAPMSFEEMTPLGARAYADYLPEQTIQPTRRAIHREEGVGDIDPQELKLLQARNQSMIKNQKKVERKVHGKNKSVPFVKKGSRKRLVKTGQSEIPKAPEEQLQRNGDWEFI